jgi:hypothetical protein
MVAEEKVLTKDKVRVVVNDLREELTKFANKHGLKLQMGGARYDDNSLRLSKIEFINEVALTEAKVDTSLSDSYIAAGLATTGAILSIRDKGKLRNAVIIKGRRTKYLFRFVDDESKTEYIAPFASFKQAV